VAVDKPLRWGVIGAGGIAGAFVDDLELTESGQAVAIGSRSQVTADRFGEAHGIPHRHASYEALVADPDVDAVYIATPHSFHHDNALLALRAGKPILVEKAFTMTGAEAQAVVDEARAAGLFAMEAMWTRFLPHTAEIRKLIAAGAIGDIVTVIADHGQWFAHDPGFRLFAPELGGGALHDLGVYPLSFASMLLGRPDRIRALVDPAFTGVDGQTSMLLGHPGGAQAVLTCTSSARSATTASIVGTDGRIDVDGNFYATTTFTLRPRKGEPVRYEQARKGRGMFHEADEVARCLAAGELESPLMPLDETVSIMETIDAVLAQGG
jgi:predicted dehydrogenase